MFKQKRLIKTTEHYTAKHNMCICDGLICDISNGEILNKLKNQKEIFSFGEESVISRNTNNGDSVIIDSKGATINKNLKIDSFNYPYFTFYNLDSIDKEGVYNFISQQTLFETTEWLGRDIIGERIFSYYHGVVTSRSVLNGKIQWQFNLSELGTWLYDKKEERHYEVDKFIGVYNTMLLASCFSGVIISLELQTGKLLHQWSTYPESYTMDRFTVTGINPSHCSQLDTPNNTLVGFNFFTLWKIDLQTTQLNVTNLKEEFAKYDLRTIKRTMGFVVTKTHYIITAESTIKEHINRGLDCLLAINKQTHIIDWKHQFAENEALKSNDIPQYANEKIYQLDWDNTLHIFEKEER
ncbi:hypothetical protein [Maribacter litoralis]|uniref:hypothetical protein n=1 Tax=Maribacter litoralis TaxID=2059726 RepID=UPI003D2986F0